METIDASSSQKSGASEKRRCLVLNAKILYYLGFWPSEGKEERRFLFYWRYFLPRVTLIRSLYGTLFHVINISIVWGDVPSMAEYLIACDLHGLIAVATATMFYYREDLKRLFDELDTFHHPRMVFNEHLRSILNSMVQFIARFTKIWMFGTTFLASLSIISISAEGMVKRVLPFKLWLPYEYKSSPIFEATLICTSILSTLDLFILNACYITFVCPALITGVQFQLLSYKLHNIREHVERKLKDKMARQILALGSNETVSGSMCAAMELDVCLAGCQGGDGTKPIGDIINDNLNGREVLITNTPNQHNIQTVLTSGANQSTADKIKDVTIESGMNCVAKELDVCVAGCHCGDGTKPMGDIIDDTVPNGEEVLITDAPNQLEIQTVLTSGANRFTSVVAKDAEMETYLRHCIKHHQKLLSITKSLGHIFRLLLSLLVIYLAAGGFATIYLTTLAKTTDTKVLGIMALMMTLYVEVLLLCMTGARISTEIVGADCSFLSYIYFFSKDKIPDLFTPEKIILPCFKSHLAHNIERFNSSMIASKDPSD